MTICGKKTDPKPSPSMRKTNAARTNDLFKTVFHSGGLPYSFVRMILISTYATGILNLPRRRHNKPCTEYYAQVWLYCSPQKNSEIRDGQGTTLTEMRIKQGRAFRLWFTYGRSFQRRSRGENQLGGDVITLAYLPLLGIAGLAPTNGVCIKKASKPMMAQHANASLGGGAVNPCPA